MDDAQLLRYSRQIMLPGLGIEGQERLRAASVLVVGLGGLGSPVAMYLAAAGIGRLVLADFDAVDLSNLQRQIIHTTDRIGRPKADSARLASQESGSANSLSSSSSGVSPSGWMPDTFSARRRSVRTGSTGMTHWNA